MKAFHVCLNMLGGSNWLGGTTYIQNIAKAISILPSYERKNVTVSVTASTANIANVDDLKNVVDKVFINGFGNRVVLEVINRLPDKMYRFLGATFNNRNIDFFYPETVGRRFPYNYGSWIPDFQHRYMPEFFSQAEIKMRNKMYSKIANNAPIIVLSSKMALDDFNNFYPHAAQRSTILNFCSYIDEKWFEADPQIIQKKYDLPDNFFIVCNQFWKHKGHDTIIEALNLLKKSGKQIYIVCTGHTIDVRFPEYIHEIKTVISKFGIEKNIIILGLIPRFDQIQLIRQSLAVIQPSLFEGWSTVIEDARSVGKEIFVSDFPVHIEQNPPYANFFKRGDCKYLSQLMIDALHNLNPGPDKKREQKSIIENRKRLFNLGKSFLQIAVSVDTI